MKITIDRAVLDQALKALEAATPVKAKDPQMQADAIVALREALAQPQQEPAWWPAVENILDEYGLQAIDFVADFKAALAQPQQEPVFWYRPRSDGRYEGPIHNAVIEKVRRESGGWMPLYTSPSASTATSEDVLVPIGILEAAESSLGSFCSNLGWSANDMQTMDNLSAYIAKHKAAHGIKDTP